MTGLLIVVDEAEAGMSERLTDQNRGHRKGQSVLRVWRGKKKDTTELRCGDCLSLTSPPLSLGLIDG